MNIIQQICNLSNTNDQYKVSLVNKDTFCNSIVATSLYDKITERKLGITTNNQVVRFGLKYKKGYQRLIGLRTLVILLKRLNEDEKELWRSKKLYIPCCMLDDNLQTLRNKYYNFAEDMLEDLQNQRLMELKRECAGLAKSYYDYICKEEKARNLRISCENAWKFTQFKELAQAETDFITSAKLVNFSLTEQNLRYLSFLNVFSYVEYIEPVILDKTDVDKCQRCGDTGFRCTLCGSYWCDYDMDHRLHYLYCCKKGYRYLAMIRQFYGTGTL